MIAARAAPVFCEDCRHRIVRLDAKRDLPPYRWLCMRWPRLDAGNFVSRSVRISEPYRRCHHANPDGKCTMFDPENHDG